MQQELRFTPKKEWYNHDWKLIPNRSPVPRFNPRVTYMCTKCGATKFLTEDFKRRYEKSNIEYGETPFCQAPKPIFSELNLDRHG